MSTQYRVYENDGAGGPIDYTTVIATVSGLTWLSGTLTYPGSYQFAVRAFDTVSGLEEQNVDALVSLTLDAGGLDITDKPSPVTSITAEQAAAGGAVIRWTWNPAAIGGNPTGFKVWATAGPSVNYAAAPAATVTSVKGQTSYAATISGLSDGTAYAVGVRAYNALADDGNVLSASVTGDTTPPADVESLAATSI